MSCHHHCQDHAAPKTRTAALLGALALGALATMAALSGVHICADEVQMVSMGIAALQGSDPLLLLRLAVRSLA
jgi:hypothetical protein